MLCFQGQSKKLMMELILTYLVVILVVIKPRLGLRVIFGIKNMKNTMQNINLAWPHYIHWKIYEFLNFLLVKIKNHRLKW